VSARVPGWARELVVDVALPEQLWTRVTDFALTVWDSTGALIGEQPLNYAVGRHSFTVDTLAGAQLEVELFPAFALKGDTSTWSASVDLSFLAAEPLAADPTRKVSVESGKPAVLPAPAMPAGLSLPDGFAPLLETTARPEEGAAASRRGAVSAGAGSPATR
jgi:hypothetical protein